MLDTKAPPAARVVAAQAILDRGYGKPKQTLDMAAILGLFDLTRLSDAQLEQWEELIAEAVGSAIEGG
jgi:hypothetical protein